MGCSRFAGFNSSGAVKYEPLDWQQCVKDYLPLVKKEVRIIVERLQLREYQEDLLQAGLMGLMEAVRVYRPGAMALSNFVRFRVKGAIIDEIRRLDWRPRRISRFAAKINHVIAQLQQRMGRNPTDREIASELDISLVEYFQQLDEIYLGQIEVLDFSPQTVSTTDGNGSAEQQQIREESAFLLARALADLDQRERTILKLYYEHELSMHEIADIVALSEARVCQIHKQCLLTLRCKVQMFLMQEDAR